MLYGFCNMRLTYITLLTCCEQYPNMRKILLFVFLLICFSQLNAQQWALQEGGTNNDRGTSIIADKNGHIYATGYFSSSATFGTTTLTSAGSYDGYLAKYDTSGYFIWASGDEGFLSFNDVPIDKQNNIDLIGTAVRFRLTQQ